MIRYECAHLIACVIIQCSVALGRILFSVIIFGALLCAKK